MQKFKSNFGFIFAIIIGVSLIIACGNKNEPMGDKDNTTTKKEETKSSSSAGNQVYFVEEYSKDGEVGKSDKFFISSKGGYLTAMLKTASPVGVGTVDVRIERETLDGSEIISTKAFDVSPDGDYFYFPEITFYKSGDYKVTVFKKDGTPIANGKVRIEFK